jgi:predicted nucleic acid-binding protein
VLIVDAGPLYAAAAQGDVNHDRSVELLTHAPRPLIVPALVVAEVGHLLSDRLGAHAEATFARSIAGGELVVEPVLDTEWVRIAELTEQYADLSLGIVDASLVVLAERFEAHTVTSFDHRHLATVRRPTAPPSPWCRSRKAAGVSERGDGRESSRCWTRGLGQRI